MAPLPYPIQHPQQNHAPTSPHPYTFPSMHPYGGP